MFFKGNNSIILNMEPISTPSNILRTCGYCNQDINLKMNSRYTFTTANIHIFCDGECKKCFHIDCVPMSIGELDEIQYNEYKFWFCKSCCKTTPKEKCVEGSSSSLFKLVSNSNNSTCKMAPPAEIGGFKLGKVIIEGKTKVVYDLPTYEGHCILVNKDRITAGDGVKAHDLAGKAAISNQTNGKVFGILQQAGLNTGFVKSVSDTAFIAKKCSMVPIEWVTRRLATGSFLKRNEGVPEGYRFAPVKTETFFKDDANHDPQWSEEQIVAKQFEFNGLKIGQAEVDIMRETSIVVFEILEKAWATRDCALIDMKIEFGVDEKGEIMVADVIDSDSWRLWPSGDKRLMKDKQVYRNLTTVGEADLNTIKSNFQWISTQLDNITIRPPHLVVIFMGSASDREHCAKIAKHCENLGLTVEMRVTSAHKGTEDTLKVLRKYESNYNRLVLIAVAGRSNGLGPVLSGNSAYPVISCPPVNVNNANLDIWSSINVPSGLGCSTVMYPEAAALQAAQILGIGDFVVWSKLRVRILSNMIGLKMADKALNQ